MPDELWKAISGHSPELRLSLLRNWQRIGPDGREKLARYVTRGWTRKGRTVRAKMAADQLFSPSCDPKMSLPGSVLPPG